MRQHIFVTGQPGIGKSTLIQKVLAQLSHQTSLAALNKDGNSSSAKSPHTNIAMDPTATGFYTEEIRVGGERVGFDVVTLQGQRGTLARTGAASRGTPVVGKYVVNVAAFEALALPAIKPTAATRLVVIDEVGKMELCSASFHTAVQKVLDDPQLLVLGSIPIPTYGRTIPQVEALRTRPDVQVVTVNKNNRDRLVAELAEQVQEAMQQLQAAHETPDTPA